MQRNLGEKDVAEQKRNSRMPALACVLIAVVVVASLLAYFNFSGLASENGSPEGSYHRLFGSTPIVGGNYSFSPPVPMYRAIDIALESDGWNASSLENMTVHATLNYEIFYTNASALLSFAAKENLNLTAYPNPNLNATCSGIELIREITAPVDSYQPQFLNGLTCRYIWVVTVTESSGFICIPPPGDYFVDAATSEVVPLGIHLF
jgi:hypothetical protein